SAATQPIMIRLEGPAHARVPYGTTAAYSAKPSISGEREVHVQPLGLPRLPGGQSATAVDVVQSEAGQLFVERVRAVQPDLELTEANANAVAEISHRLDGLPLALELAASRARLLPLPWLAERLERRLPMLVGGGRDLPSRQQTLEFTVAWSFSL